MIVHYVEHAVIRLARAPDGAAFITLRHRAVLVFIQASEIDGRHARSDALDTIAARGHRRVRFAALGVGQLLQALERGGRELSAGDAFRCAASRPVLSLPKDPPQPAPGRPAPYPEQRGTLSAAQTRNLTL